MVATVPTWLYRSSMFNLMSNCCSWVSKMQEPIRLANKQDKMNALLGSELIELLSLEKLVNQSRSLCHIEPCSASMDLRRWTDRKTLRGLRWLLRAVCLDYPELCARLARESKRPLTTPSERDRPRRSEKGRRKTKEQRLRSSKSDLRQVHRPQDKEKMHTGGKMQPIRNMLQKENTLKKKLKKSKKKQVKIEEDTETELGDEIQQQQQQKEERDREDSVEGELESSPQKEKASSEKRKKKRVIIIKRKNKINTEEVPAAGHLPAHPPADLSATLDLYRKAILTLKERQDQGR
ncbi:hypothetical protein CRUP_036526 [Coryphaenoides rupestris]|nr:hypothetical protein CRUP_036526 [Coryphaenoides rupestris]